MENDPEPIKEILDELFSLLESLETQNLALTQFLKDQGIATDEKLSPYLDRAGNTSSVKWRAARARMQYLLPPVAKKTDDEAKDKNKESEEPQPEKQATEKQPTEKPSTEQNRPTSPDVTKDTAQNQNANTLKDAKPGAPKSAAKEGDKKSDSREKSNRK
jgi:chemotaxis protein histidine kinase CheA